MDSRENEGRKREEGKWEVDNSRENGRTVIGAIVNNNDNNFFNEGAIKGRRAKRQ